MQAVAQQDAIEVYSNDAGAIVIRQVRSVCAAEDTDEIVFVLPENAAALCAAIMAQASGDGVEPEPANESRDKTNAERQRRYRERLRAQGDAASQLALCDAK